MGCTAVLALFAPVRYAHATTVAELTLKEKVQRSKVVVIGVVEDLTPFRPAGESVVHTQVSVRVERGLVGSAAPGDRVHFERVGGTLDGVTDWAPGLHVYAIGDPILVFLEALPPSARSSGGPRLVTVGVGIGTYTVVRTPPCTAPRLDCARFVLETSVAQLRPDGTLVDGGVETVGWSELADALGERGPALPRVPQPAIDVSPP